MGALQEVHVWTSGLDLENRSSFCLQIHCFGDTRDTQQFCSPLSAPMKFQCIMGNIFKKKKIGQVPHSFFDIELKHLILKLLLRFCKNKEGVPIIVSSNADEKKCIKDGRNLCSDFQHRVDAAEWRQPTQNCETTATLHCGSASLLWKSVTLTAAQLWNGPTGNSSQTRGNWKILLFFFYFANANWPFANMNAWSDKSNGLTLTGHWL